MCPRCLRTAEWYFRSRCVLAIRSAFGVLRLVGAFFLLSVQAREGVPYDQSVPKMKAVTSHTHSINLDKTYKGGRHKWPAPKEAAFTKRSGRARFLAEVPQPADQLRCTERLSSRKARAYDRCQWQKANHKKCRPPASRNRSAPRQPRTSKSTKQDRSAILATPLRSPSSPRLAAGYPTRAQKKLPATRPITQPHQSKTQPTNPPAQAFLNRQFDHRLNQSARRAFSIAKSIPFQALLAIPRCQILSG